MFSDMMKESNWKAHEKVSVIKRANVDYDQYWSEKNQKFGPLLEATLYEDVEVPSVNGGVEVNYREVIGLK